MPQEYSSKEFQRGISQASPVIETLGEILELTDSESEDVMELTDCEASGGVIELSDSEPSDLVASRVLKSKKKTPKAKTHPSVRRSHAYSSVLLI